MWKGFELQFGIDLGTSSTLIYQAGKGVVLQEPSALAVNRNTGKIEAIGTKAEAMVGRTPAHLEVIYPLQEGVIANFDMAVTMLQHFISIVLGRWDRLYRSRIHISTPHSITNVQKRAIQDAIRLSGSKHITMVDEPLAAALGAGLPIEEPTGCFLLDIGAGSCKSAILSLGGVIFSHATPYGGLSLDHDIMEYIKKRHNIAIGEKTAEQIKKKLGSATRPTENGEFIVRGCDSIRGLPKAIALTSPEVHSLLDDWVMAIIDLIKMTLEQCPPELAGDILERGLTLTGGGSLLSGLEQRLREELKIPVYVIEKPQECVVLGAGKYSQAFPKPIHGKIRKLASLALQGSSSSN